MTRQIVERGEVISMVARRAEQERAPLRQMLDYWQSLPATPGGLPARADVEPRAIEDLLDRAFLLEALTPEIALLRVAGGHLSDLIARDATGLAFSDLFAADAVLTLRRAVRDVFAARQGVELELVAHELEPGAPLVGSLILLPLRAEDGRVSRALGCLVTRGRIGYAPRRFSITANRLIALPASKEICAASTVRHTKKAQPQPRLRLVVSN